MQRRRARRGIVGIEAAIVMIAFVIVAAAIAFVALNMGMTTTQKTKEAIGASLGEASSALMVDGDVIGYYDQNASGITAVAIPIRITSGKYPVDLSVNRTVVSLQTSSYYDNIYTLEPNTTTTNTSISAMIATVEATNASKPVAKTFFIVNDGDSVLEYGEKAVVLVVFKNPLKSYDTFTVIIKPPEGAPLVVQRTIPASLPSQSGPVDLG